VQKSALVPPNTTDNVVFSHGYWSEENEDEHLVIILALLHTCTCTCTFLALPCLALSCLPLLQRFVTVAL